MLLYYITDRSQFPGTEAQRRSRLLEKIAEAARAGVDLIQLREKDLPARDLESLARDAARIVRDRVAQPPSAVTRLLINHRLDIALAVGAGGVHLRSDDISAADARALLSRNEKRETRNFLIAVSCHTSPDVARAAADFADFAVFAPVFEKAGATATGLEALRRACAHRIPVLALGGVTIENARKCLAVGAAGISGIRLFQESDVGEVVAKLRPGGR